MLANYIDLFNGKAGTKEQCARLLKVITTEPGRKGSVNASRGSSRDEDDSGLGAGSGEPQETVSRLEALRTQMRMRSYCDLDRRILRGADEVARWQPDKSLGGLNHRGDGLKQWDGALAECDDRTGSGTRSQVSFSSNERRGEPLGIAPPKSLEVDLSKNVPERHRPASLPVRSRATPFAPDKETNVIPSSRSAQSPRLIEMSKSTSS